jgi:hypothetical protein
VSLCELLERVQERRPRRSGQATHTQFALVGVVLLCPGTHLPRTSRKPSITLCAFMATPAVGMRASAIRPPIAVKEPASSVVTSAGYSCGGKERVRVSGGMKLVDVEPWQSWLGGQMMQCTVREQNASPA